jgi:hypothetical protein
VPKLHVIFWHVCFDVGCAQLPKTDTQIAQLAAPTGSTLLQCAAVSLACCLQGHLPGAARGLASAGGYTALGAKRAPASQLNSPSPFLPTQQQQPLQVLLRVRVVKPNTHNTLASLQMNLAGLLLNAKSDGGDELLNLTVDTVQCALLTTTSQRQLSLGVLSVQLDNQLLATRHPVVLSPASLAEVSWGCRIWWCQLGCLHALWDPCTLLAQAACPAF